MACGSHQHLLKLSESGFRFVSLFAKLFSDFVVKVFKKLLPRFRDRFVDLEAQLQLQLIECSLDLFVLSAALVDVVDALLEIDARLDCSQYFIACAEDAFEEMELFREQFVNTFVCAFLPIEEIDYDN